MFKEEEVADCADEYKHYKLLTDTAHVIGPLIVSFLYGIPKKKKEFESVLMYLMVCGCWFCWASSRLLVSWLIVGTRSKITGKFRTSCLQTSQIRVPFVLNHLMAQCSWTSLRSPLQLHSIFSVLPSSHTSRQILHTASSSGISSSVSSAGTGVIWSANENTRKKEHWSLNFPFHWSKIKFLWNYVPMNP